jgi:hypothetical protein
MLWVTSAVSAATEFPTVPGLVEGLRPSFPNQVRFSAQWSGLVGWALHPYNLTMFVCRF